MTNTRPDEMNAMHTKSTKDDSTVVSTPSIVSFGFLFSSFISHLPLLILGMCMHRRDVCVPSEDEIVGLVMIVPPNFS
jgi:hypothetical protein